MAVSVKENHTIEKSISDYDLIGQILKGNKTALEELIKRYKDWIFNVTIRMVTNPSESEDVTQEILIKIITQLGKYDKTKASFKTWLYRITVNHILNMKKRGIEKYEITFDNFYERMNYVTDKEPEDSEKIRALVRDTMTNCVIATLVCLNREQRMVVVLGVIFDIDSKTGADILNIKPANFRQILSRSKKKLKSFMSNTCSLINPRAGCVCKMRITDLIALGYRNPEKLIYSKLNYNKTVREKLGIRVTSFLNNYFDRFNIAFRNQPYWESPDLTKWLSDALNSSDLREMFSL